MESVTRAAYSYASNDPVNRTDPTGMFDIPSWVPGIGGMCVDIGDPNCQSPRDGCSTGLSSAIVNFAGGVLTMNPITAFLPLDLAGHGVDSSSGWYTAGQVSMAVTDVGLGTAWAAGARVRFALHDAHHTFGALGRLPHLQWNFWRQGVKGSGFTIRIPLPRWFK